MSTPNGQLCPHTKKVVFVDRELGEFRLCPTCRRVWGLGFVERGRDDMIPATIAALRDTTDPTDFDRLSTWAGVMGQHLAEKPLTVAGLFTGDFAHGMGQGIVCGRSLFPTEFTDRIRATRREKENERSESPEENL